MTLQILLLCQSLILLHRSLLFLISRRYHKFSDQQVFQRNFRSVINKTNVFSCCFHTNCTSHDVVVVSGCPISFSYIEEQGVCYHLFEMNLQRQAASQYCRAVDSRAHLLVIDDEEEQEFVVQALSEYPSEFTHIVQTKYPTVKLLLSRMFYRMRW